MATKWHDLKLRKMTPEQIAKIEREVAEELHDMDLRELREAAGKTQEEVAKALQTAQPEISNLERRDDFRISTLRKYVTALGGELEVVANFGNRRVRLRAS
jgi:transcriptional regulator with XRE-family HTH domain